MVSDKPITLVPSTPSLAVSFDFVEERGDDDWGDSWVWDRDDPTYPTVQWLGFIPRAWARHYADSHGYPFYGQPLA
jgi:hypothetical protein